MCQLLIIRCTRYCIIHFDHIWGGGSIELYVLLSLDVKRSPSAFGILTNKIISFLHVSLTKLRILFQGAEWILIKLY